MNNIRYNAYREWDIATTATSSTGANFVPLLGADSADEVTIILQSSDNGGVALDVSHNGTDYAILEAPSGFVIPLGGQTSEIQVRRHDQSNTPFTVRYMWGRYRR